MSDTIVLQQNEGTEIGIVTLNRPEKRNALSVRLMTELREAILAQSKVIGRRVIVLEGKGPAFCAGLDLGEAGDAAKAAEALKDLYETIYNVPLVTIAAVQGAAIGGGAGLLAACDLVVGEEGSIVGFPEVRRGLVAALVTCLIRRQVGDRMARELILLGETLPASRAMELGLINRIAPTGKLAATTMELAREACKGAPGAIARSKRLLDALSARPIGEELAVALRFHLEARSDAEAAEGIAAFRTGREARWS